MSEVFEFEYNVLQEMLIVNHQEGFSYNMCHEDDVYSVTTKLNEQQATIQKQSERIRELESILADDIVRKSEIKDAWKKRKDKHIGWKAL